jgi:glutathione peroxidase
MTIYNYALKTLQGKPFDVNTLKGKVVLIVNTASKCGLTPQFKGLEELHQKYKEKGLVILGFPCNQFGAQEPGVGDEIQQFCSRNYGVTFQIMEKIDVNGDTTYPLYSYLKSEKKFLGIEAIKWNFEKFLVNREGIVVDRYAPATEPHALEKDIEKYLNQ